MDNNRLSPYFRHLFLNINALTEKQGGSLDLKTIIELRKQKEEGTYSPVFISGEGLTETLFLSQSVGFFDKKVPIGVIAENGGVFSLSSENKSEVIYLCDKTEVWEVLKKNIDYKEFQILKKASMYERDRVTDIVVSSECSLFLNQEFCEKLEKNGLRVTRGIDSDIHIHLKKINKGEGIRAYLSHFIRKRAEEKTEEEFSKIDLSENLNLALSCAMFFGNSEEDLSAAQTVGNSAAIKNSPLDLIESSDYHCKQEYGKGILEGIAYFSKSNVLN